MPRRNDVFVAFREAIQLNPKGYMCLRTGDFIVSYASTTTISQSRTPTGGLN
jgi:hypothetical protein